MGEIALIHAARGRVAAEHTETRSDIEKQLAEARLKLVETGTRNRLVHTPRAARRSRSLQIVGAAADSVFMNLVRESKVLRFFCPDESADVPPDAARPKGPRLVTAKISREIRNGLMTSLSPDHLQRRLHTIHRDARTAEEERGMNILFLTLGFLRWYEDDKSDVLRQAPLVLLPVSLVRDPRRSTFDLKFRDDEITTNQALQERLRNDFAISLPSVPESEDWVPSGYFEAVAEAVKSKRRWSIDSDSVELGFYSFSKLLMVRDLEPGMWPNHALVSHPLLRGLLCDGFGGETPIFAETTNLDEVFTPADLVQVVDADSSQTKVIETVRAGRNLVVQGPPGTGKSQTITNIIASAVHDGKTVLFVAEKMAALEVVHNRLRNAGLEDICLELHGQAVSKRRVADRLDKTLQAAAPSNGRDCADRLTIVRDRLNRTAMRLHEEIADTGMTPYQALSNQIMMAQRGITPDTRLVTEAGSWSKAEFDLRRAATRRLAALTASAGPLDAHVFVGLRRTNLQPAELQRLVPRFRSLAGKAAALADEASGVAAAIGFDQARSLADIKTLISILRIFAQLPAGGERIAIACAAASNLRRVIDAATLAAKWQAHQAPLDVMFHASAWSATTARLRAPLAMGAAHWLARRGKAYREASGVLARLSTAPLPPRPCDRLALLDRLIENQAMLGALGCDAGFLAALLGPAWHGKKTDFMGLLHIARTIETIISVDPRLEMVRAIESLRDGAAIHHANRLEAGLTDLVVSLGPIVHGLDLDIAAAFRVGSVKLLRLDALAARAEAWAAESARFEQWARLSDADGVLRALGPAEIVDGLASGRLDPERAVAELEAAYAEACWLEAIDRDPDLAGFDGTRQDALVARFGELEAARRDADVRSIRARHQSMIPTGALGAMGVIRGEIGRKRNSMPLRKLMTAAGAAIQKIKPVFLMSPISVAQFLPPGAVEFDLLVIDEASQIRPAEALGIIARCRQIVVVGDKKQLPPTSFFDRLIADEADSQDEDEEEGHPSPAGVAAVSDLESILSLCEARGLESRMLRWHYRSRHKSLIEVSNAEFYHRLVMPPAPTLDRTDKGLVLRRVQGAYDRGGTRTNLVEAEAIVAAAADHARDRPRQSLGIVTFSTVQRDLVCELLEARRRDDPVLDAYLRESSGEDVFVKNLENVQGDERDVILISVGFGPREAGKPLDSMAFGPISAEGGERRLNVLFTRARSRCEVFVSFGPGEINLDRATGEGPRVLERFLRYAETGVLDESAPTGADFDSPFEAAVAEAIESLGYKVDAQIGSAGFKIDLAVRDPSAPGRYILAIECDGATYHSALWARERDRLRQENLERLGWRFHRIWSTDWFYRRAAQLDKLKEVLDAARRQAGLGPAPRTQAPERVASAPGSTRQPLYALTRCEVPAGLDLLAATAEQIAGIVEAVIEQEGPIHRDEITRRVASLFGKERVGSRIDAAVGRGLNQLAARAPRLAHAADFWFTAAQKLAPPVRDRTTAPASLQRFDKIAPIEIAAAIEIMRQQDPSLSEGDVPAAVAGLLGLPKATPNLCHRVRSLVGSTAVAA